MHCGEALQHPLQELKLPRPCCLQHFPILAFAWAVERVRNPCEPCVSKGRKTKKLPCRREALD